MGQIIKYGKKAFGIGCLLAAAMTVMLDATAMAYAESLSGIDPGDQGHVNIAICIIGTPILLGAIYHFLRDK